MLDSPKEDASVDAHSSSMHPTIICFLQSAARGAAALRSNSDSSSNIQANTSNTRGNGSNSTLESSSALAAEVAPTLCISSSSSGDLVDSLQLLHRLVGGEQANSSVLHQLLQLLLLLPAAESSAMLSAAANRYMQHLDRLLLAARLQQRHKKTNPRTLNPIAEP